jgi:NodT family efflux transporter outer membrane factor (OMF) lipoprotein
MSAAFALVVGLVLCGCTSVREYVHNGFKVGPNYARPPAPVAQRWIDADDVRIRSDSEDESCWWTVFNDPVLNDLVQEAHRQNLTLREAGYRVLRARAELGIATGKLFPQKQDMHGDFERRNLSNEAANRFGTPQLNYDQWDLNFGLAWELDFWGRFRRAIEASAAELDASVEDYDAVLVTLLGDVATEYVRIRTLQQRIAYARENIRLQGETFKIATARFKGGEVSELDANQAQSDLSRTEALIPQLEIPLRAASNRLCILLGMPPEELTRRLGDAPIPIAPEVVAIGIPAELLRRRPDVRRAERKAAAQCARIGVAVSDLYPAISVSGSLGWSAQDIPGLFAGDAFQGVVGPSFTWNVLNYGRLLGNIRAQDARFSELVVAYQNTVLRANEEVENGLVRFLRSHDTVRLMTTSVDAELKAVKDAIAQYQGGLADFNRVALIQERLVERQEELVQAKGQIAEGLVQVYRALGGGWQIRLASPAGGVVGEPLAPLEIEALEPPEPEAVPLPPPEAPPLPGP